MLLNISNEWHSPTGRQGPVSQPAVAPATEIVPFILHPQFALHRDVTGLHAGLLGSMFYKVRTCPTSNVYASGRPSQ
jgi:hypothetical protein